MGSAAHARRSPLVLAGDREPRRRRTAAADSARRARTRSRSACSARSPGPAASIGNDQLHWAQFFATRGTRRTSSRSTIVQGDTQLDPAKASTVVAVVRVELEHRRRHRPGR